CGLVCVGGTTKCANVCVDTKCDPANCGGCGKACGQGEVCSNGACGLVCGGGATKCGNVCVDTKTDPANCGSCGKACAKDEVCVNSACGLVCVGGTTKCGSACVNTNYDPAHCGGCNKPCGNNQACLGGQCVNAGKCPPPGFEYKNFCWIVANAWQENQSSACSRIGKSPTAQTINVVWDAGALTAVSQGFGYTSIGVYQCCANAMWCNVGAKQCGTHNYHGSQYNNYGPYGDSNWWPVYTCNP
ncbi:MAG: hypothetical protein HY744_27940, partial [Deltaproteobacteria bacterium]|nr:hypothetical protein [Deltaproteobacteria bacterium]